MRTVNTAFQRLLGTDGGDAKRQRVAHLRVTLLNNRGGTGWSTVLTSYGARNWVRGVEFGEELDSTLSSATIRLAREAWSVSLAPYVSSVANRANGTATQLLRPVREVKIEVQLAPSGTAPNDAGAWDSVFEGYVATIDWGAADNEIVLACRDRLAFLQDLFIEQEQPPKAGGANWYTANWLTGTRTLENTLQDVIDATVMNDTATWAASTSYAVGAIRRPTVRNGFAYQVTAKSGTGTSSATQPTWPTVIGATVTDNAGANQVVWTCYSELPAIWTPVSSLLVLNAPPPSDPLWRREPVLDVLRRLAAMRGWTIRMSWDGATSAWRPTLYEPKRTYTSPNLTLRADSYEVQSARIDIAGVRNAVRVVYPSGTARTQSEVTVTDATSLSDYGRRFCELAEASTSQIDTSGEATDLANLVLKDLSRPYAEVQVKTPFRHDVEPGDCVALAGGHRYWTTDTAYSVVGVSHSIGDGGAWTTLRMREVDTATAVMPALFVFWAKVETRYALDRQPAGSRSEALTQGSQSSPDRCRVRVTLTSDQTVAAGEEATLQFNVRNPDRGGDHDTATYRFVVPANGVYAFSATAIIGALTSGTTARLSIQVAVPTVYEIASALVTATASKNTNVAVTASVTNYHLAGDQIRVRLQNNDTVSRSVLSSSTSFSATRVY